MITLNESLARCETKLDARFEEILDTSEHVLREHGGTDEEVESEVRRLHLEYLAWRRQTLADLRKQLLAWLVH